MLTEDQIESIREAKKGKHYELRKKFADEHRLTLEEVDLFIEMDLLVIMMTGKSFKGYHLKRVEKALREEQVHDSCDEADLIDGPAPGENLYADLSIEFNVSIRVIKVIERLLREEE